MQDEITGRRCELYSTWHRLKSMSRFVSRSTARAMGMIDLDVTIWCEYHDGSKEPLLFIETARDVGQSWKTAVVTQRIGECSGRPAFTVLYKPNRDETDIEAFRVQRRYPNPTDKWTSMDPKEYAIFLLGWRQKMVRKLGLREAECEV